MNEFFTADFAQFFLPLAGAVVAWVVTRQRERLAEDYRRKEERYQALMLAVRGFHDPHAPTALRQKFFDEFYLCWLYCPDAVIEAGVRLVETIADGNPYTPDDRRAALGNFVLAIRKDLLSRKVVKRTELVPIQFRPFNAQ